VVAYQLTTIPFEVRMNPSIGYNVVTVDENENQAPGWIDSVVKDGDGQLTITILYFDDDTASEMK
jgi:hypothetical protein